MGLLIRGRMGRRYRKCRSDEVSKKTLTGENRGNRGTEEGGSKVMRGKIIGRELHELGKRLNRRGAKAAEKRR